MATNDDDKQRIRSYLQAQGAKLSAGELVERVQAAMAELRSALDAVPPAQREQRPAPEEWSAGEVMAHVVTAGRYFGEWITSSIDGCPDEPVLTGEGDGQAPTSRTAVEWWAELARDREALFARVLAAEPDVRLERRIPHGWFGPLNWREALLFLRLHDLDHAGQIRRAAIALHGGAPGVLPASP
jgi:uncharacterized damage-inducible protein DinB